MRFLSSASLLWVLVCAPALAAPVQVFHDGPLLADGATDSLVQVYLPGISARDELKVSAKGASVVDYEAGPQGTLFVTLRPRAVDDRGTISLRVEGVGSTHVDERFELPVEARPARVGAATGVAPEATFAFVDWPTNTGLPAGDEVSLWLYVAAPDGTPIDRVPSLQIVSTASVEVDHPGGGWHEVRVTVPGTLGPFTVTASLGAEHDSLVFRSIPGIPEIALSAAPDRLSEDATEVALDAHFTASAAHDAPTVWTPEGPVEGPVVASDRLVAHAGTDFVPSGLPAARLRLWPGQTWAGPSETIPLFVLVEDALGLPVPEQVVSLSGTRLEGLAASIDTGARGWTVVYVKRVAGDVAEPIRVEASAGSLRAATVLWPHVGALGTTDDARARARWGRAIPTLVLRRDAKPAGTAVEDPPHGPRRREQALAPPPAPREPKRTAGPSVGWRAHLGLVDIGYGANEEALDGTWQPTSAHIGDRLPAGAFGFGGSAEVVIDDRFIGDFDFRWTRFGTDLDGLRQKGTLGMWRLGGRYQGTITGPLRWQVGAWLVRGDVPFVSLDNSGNAELLRHFALTGLALGGGIALDLDPVDVRLEVTEAFTIAPTWTTARLRGDVPIGVDIEDLPLHISAGLDFDYRLPKHQTSIGASDGTFRVRDTQFVVFVGVGIGSF